MRVLHVFKTYYPDSFGGVERTIHAIARGALEHGIRSDVLSLSDDPDTNTVEFDGHMAYKSKLDFEFASTGFSRDFFQKFKDLSAQADIIHYHFPWPFMDAMHLLYPPGKPTVLTYHSDIVKQKLLLQVYKPLMHRFLASITQTVVTSPNYLVSSDVLQRYRHKTQVIPIGLDEADYPPASDEVRTSWEKRFPKPFFLFVGVLRYYKGLHTLIEAAKHVDADILIVGNGPMERQLKVSADRAGQSNVHFLGAISDLDKSALLTLCRAFVFPSHLRSEAFGLSLVEAAMFSKPMISCEIGTGTSFVNVDNETGFVVNPNDPKGLAGKMMQILHDDDLTRLLGIAARARYKELFTAEKMAHAYAKLYLANVGAA
jgi:glycosyltransferase involved in cell wall biosynthesis